VDAFMELRKTSLVMLLGVTLFSSCKKEKGDVIARIDGTEITSQEIELQIPEGFKGDPNVRNEVFKQYLEEVLLYKAALDEGILKNEDLQAHLKVTEVKVVSQYFINEKFGNIEIPEQLLNEEFANSKPYFEKKIDLVILYYIDSTKTPYYRTLLMQPYAAIVSEINKLDPREVQLAPLSENLGVVYYSYGKELFDVISNLKIGEISNPVSLPSSGYYALIKVLNISKEEVGEEEVVDFLRRVLIATRQNNIRDSIISSLQAKYKVSEVTGK